MRNWGSVGQVIASRATVSEMDTAQQQMKDASVAPSASDRDVANEGYNRHGLLTYASWKGCCRAGAATLATIQTPHVGSISQCRMFGFDGLRAHS